ncbi:MAG: peptidylprolyl isomerase [Pseudomonadota bacterium]
MFLRVLLAGLLLAAASPLWAQEPAEEPAPRLTFVLEVEAKTGTGEIVIELLPDVAPRHVARIMTMNARGAYDNVAFHRVIDGFMAQTGDVEFGRMDDFDWQQVGRGRSNLPDIPAEFSDIPFTPGVVAMARGSEPDSANSQFFIMTADQPSLTGQYTVIGRVLEGMEMVLTLETGLPQLNGMVSYPDRITTTRIE